MQRRIHSKSRSNLSQVPTLPVVLAELQKLQSELAQRHLARTGVFDLISLRSAQKLFLAALAGEDKAALSRCPRQAIAVQ